MIFKKNINFLNNEVDVFLLKQLQKVAGKDK